MLQYRIDFMTGEAPASFKTHRLHPDFGDGVALLDMDVNRFTPVTRIEEESVPVQPKYCWHLPRVYTLLRKEVEPITGAAPPTHLKVRSICGTQYDAFKKLAASRL